MKLLFNVTVAAAALAFSLPAAAQWAWRDASGKMVFSDQAPPKSIPPKDIVRQPSGPVGPSYSPAEAVPSDPGKPVAEAGKPAAKPAAPSLADREAESKRRQQELADAEKKAADDEQRKAQLAENCQRLISHQKALDSGMRMARVSATGQREVLDDKARAAESERNRAQIEQYCQQ